MGAAAHILEHMNEKEAAVILESLPAELAVRIIKNLQISYAAAVLDQGNDTFLQQISSQLPPQLLTSVLMHLTSESRERIRKHLSGKIGRLILKEGTLGAVNGAVVGLVTAAVAWVWHGSPYLGLVIGLGMLLNLIFAGLSDAGIPLLMKRLGFDPAQSSSIILTTVTDVMGFLAFLGFAVLFRNYLM